MTRAEAVPAALSAAVRRKVNKRYPHGGSGLIIYLNIGEFGIRQCDVEACMHPATDEARHAFKQVWLIWKHRLYLLWDGGSKATATWDAPVEHLLY